MDEPEEVHVHHAAVLLALHLANRREHRRHRAVDPDVDRPELALDGVGGGLDLHPVRDVGEADERRAARVLDLAARLLEALATTRDEPDARASPRELANRGATDARGRARDRDHLPLVRALRHLHSPFVLLTSGLVI